MTENNCYVLWGVSMKEKIEVRKKQKIAYFKNDTVDEVINLKEDYTIFKLYENDTMGISCVKNSEDDEYGYYMADKGKKYEYKHTTTLNTQKNVIFAHDKVTDRKLVDMLKNIGEKLSHISKNITIKYNNIDVRYTLTNINKLHMNCENGINIFELEHNGNIFSFEYKKLNEEKIIKDMSSILSADIRKPIKTDINTIIVPTNMNCIYDFFENVLSCENVINNKLIDKKLFSEKLTLSTTLDEEDSKSTKYGLLPFFDAEGSHIPYYKTNLIENGIVVKPYANRDNAEKYEVENTACGYATKDNYPDCNLLGACIAPGYDTINQLAPSGIYIMNADIVTSGDEITINTKNAYTMENNILKDKIENFEIKVNSYRLFSEKFVGVSRDTVISGDNVKGIVFNI